MQRSTPTSSPGSSSTASADTLDPRADRCPRPPCRRLPDADLPRPAAQRARWWPVRHVRWRHGRGGGRFHGGREEPRPPHGRGRRDLHVHLGQRSHCSSTSSAPRGEQRGPPPDRRQPGPRGPPVARRGRLDRRSPASAGSCSGRNGSGKTSLLRIASLYLHPERRHRRGARRAARAHRRAQAAHAASVWPARRWPTCCGPTSPPPRS